MQLNRVSWLAFVKDLNLWKLLLILSLDSITANILGWNGMKLQRWANCLHIPERADIPENIKEHLIVELYSK